MVAMTKILKILTALGVATFAILAIQPRFSQARPFTAQDMATLDRVDAPRVSPDGKTVLFDVRVVDYAANKASHRLWVVDTSGTGTPRELTVSGKGANDGQWSPDGKSIYFLSSRKDGLSQVFRTDLEGQAAVQVTTLPFDVGAYRLSPDGKTLVVSQAVFSDCADLACSKSRMDARKERKASGIEFDRLFVRHWDTWADGTRNHLFAVRLNDDGIAAGEPVDLMRGFDGDAPTQPFGDEEDFTIAPDGAQLVFSAKVAGHDEAWTTNFDLYAVPLDGSAAPRNLTAANKAWDAGPVFSPDGRRLAYRAMRRPGFEADRFQIIVRDLATGTETPILPDWDDSADSLKWSDDGETLYTTAWDVGQHPLYAIDVATGRRRVLSGFGHVSSFDARGGKVVYAKDDLTHPARLNVAADIASPPLTHFNEERLRDVDWGVAEQFNFPGWNGEKVHGYLVKPANFDPSKRYPVAFLIHGGPQSSFGNMFHYRWNAQAFAGAGYAVVMIDFHGSTGYGQAFTDAISRHWGDRPLEDLQKGWAYALKTYPFLDGGRACALGGSYGGYMINWISGVWNEPWKCFVNHDGVFDTRFMGYSSEELWFTEWENGGTPWSPGNDFAKFNPIDHTGSWSKPTLVVEGGKDYRVPLEEALSTFTTLQRRGVPSKFLYFPDENHWVLKPQNAVQWYTDVLAWLNQWTGKPAP